MSSEEVDNAGDFVQCPVIHEEIDQQCSMPYGHFGEHTLIVRWAAER